MSKAKLRIMQVKGKLVSLVYFEGGPKTEMCGVLSGPGWERQIDGTEWAAVVSQKAQVDLVSIAEKDGLAGLEMFLRKLLSH